MLLAGEPLYFLLPGRAEERPRAVGVGGFKGKPSWEGTAEIGYSVMPDYQRLGFALEAVAGLVGWAFPTRRGLVTAETLPALEVSIRVLENNGFHYFEEAPKKASSDTGSTETSFNSTARTTKGTNRFVRRITDRTARPGWPAVPALRHALGR